MTVKIKIVWKGRFYALYQRCTFGAYCAFKHCESLQLKEITDLNEKVKLLEFENREKSKELSDLFERLELVEQIIAEREEAFIAAAKAVVKNTTPVVKGTKKRKKTKQHPTPSPTHPSPPGLSQQSDEDKGNGQVDDEENSDVEKVLTAEEIAKLYEDTDPDENFSPSLSITTHKPNL